MADEVKEPNEPNPELAEALRIREAMQALQSHFGWKMLCDIMQEQINARFSEIVSQKSSLDQLIAEQYLKGQCQSLIMIKGYPAILIENANVIIKEQTRELD